MGILLLLFFFILFLNGIVNLKKMGKNERDKKNQLKLFFYIEDDNT